MKNAPVIAAAAVSAIGRARTAAAPITGVGELRPARDLDVDEITSRIELRTMMPASAIMADHRGRRELRAEQRVAGHHADHGERDRRHDHERHRVRAELRHDSR